MSKKHTLHLLLAIGLFTGVALGQASATAPPEPPEPPAQQDPPAPPEPMTAPESPFSSYFSFFVDGGGFLGVNTEDINKENMGRYGLREVRGVGVTSVAKDSPAEKAGLRKDDVILRVDNDNVTSVRKLTRLISEIAPDQNVRLTISRGGTQQEVAVTIGKREEPKTIQGLLKDQPNVWKWEESPGFKGSVFAFGNSRRIGVSTMQLTKQLADYFGIPDGQGVLITSVTDDGPAAVAGLKAGDVVTAIDGEKVDGAGDLSRAINKKKDGDVTLTIIRNKSQQTIRVTPKSGSFPYSMPGATQQIGRQIIIPRIELPVIPEVNISLPSIQLPIIPEINIQLPRVIKPAKVRTTTRQRTI
jgi:membrane-associated protease RseP (regulator of RpoE activity)